MAKLRLSFTLLHHILFIPFVLPLAFAAAEQTIWVKYCDSVYGNYTTNGTYSNNLNSVLTKMTSTDSNFGFYNLSAGDDSSDVAYLISLCIGNLPVSDCHTCQNRIKSQINSSCPNQKTAIYWSDDCMVRYSSNPILATVEKSPNFLLPRYVTIDSSETTNYNNFVGSLLNSLPEKASKGNSSLKFGTAQGVFDSSITIYSAAQCTPELAQNDCLECLNSAVGELESQDSGQRGARYLFPSCFVRYEESKFYFSSDGDSTDNTNIGRSNRKIKIIAASVAGGLVVLLVVMACFIFLRKRKLHWSILSNRLMDGDDNSIIESFQFNFSIIRAATGNFSEANKLGEGGFGAVYQGLLPDNKQEIAVKRLAGNSVQGENEFKTEVTLLAKLQHRNLVRLLGFSFHDKERLLIYEFVANASLDHFLFDATRHTHLNWETRYKIIRGIARGILYLHEDSRLGIIHRDLKASNVLLDAEMCPKIADFGTARLFDIDQTHSNTRRIVGTYGYMAPEYVLHGNFSTKSDVYSFGVLLLEIICGKRCSTMYTGEFSGSLISLIWRKWSEGVPLDVIDSSISDGSESQILRCIHIGLLCVQDNMVDRPTMSSVVLMMSSESLALSLPSHPAYINTLNMPLNTTDSNWLNDKSTDLESITELHVR